MQPIKEIVLISIFALSFVFFVAFVASNVFQNFFMAAAASSVIVFCFFYFFIFYLAHPLSGFALGYISVPSVISVIFIFILRLSGFK